MSEHRRFAKHKLKYSHQTRVNEFPIQKKKFFEACVEKNRRKFGKSMGYSMLL